MSLVQFIQEAPPLLSAFVLLLSSATEYLFPPFPGDVITLAGGFFAARGAIPLFLAWPALICGATVGASLSWLLGVSAIRNEGTRRYVMRFIAPEQMAKLHANLDKYGVFLLAINRFVPVVRGMLLFATGLAGMPYRRVLLWSMVSALVRDSLLIGVGYFLSLRFEKLLEIMQKYTAVLMFGVLAAGLIYLIRRKVTRR